MRETGPTLTRRCRATSPRLGRDARKPNASQAVGLEIIQDSTLPPQALISWPLMARAASVARKVTAAATSSGSRRRPSGEAPDSNSSITLISSTS